jgi:hybrid cluster-associated redox disulfide protein
MRKSLLIKKEMLISEVIKQHPDTISLFLEKGMHCIGCAFTKGETIQEAAKVHQLDLKKFLKDLNKAIKK